MKFFDEKKIEFIQKWNSSKIQNLNFSRQNYEIFSKLKIGPKTRIYFLKEKNLILNFHAKNLIFDPMCTKNYPSKNQKNRNSNFCFFLFFRWSRRIKLKIWLYLQHRKSHSIKKIFPLPSLKTVTFVFLFSSPQTKNSGGFLKMFDKIYEELLTMVDNRWGSKFCCCHWYFIL